MKKTPARSTARRVENYDDFGKTKRTSSNHELILN